MPVENYEMVGLLIFTFCTLLPLFFPLRYAARAWRLRRSENTKVLLRPLIISSVIAIMIYAAVCIDAFLIEPNWPELRRLTVNAEISQPLRILHLSDLHIEEELQPREQWLIDQVATFKPDLILVTGDTHQMDMKSVDSLNAVLSKLQAPLGVFGCVGYDNTSLLMQAAPHIPYLVNQTRMLEHGSDTIGIAGISAFGNRGALYNEIKTDTVSIVISHTPDLADEAAEAGMDLYLCGHTHGGQVRIPFWGAIITNSKSGKKYEAGTYHVGDTVINTSRGLGLEPPPAPQVRFLCRPEITLITLVPK